MMRRFASVVVMLAYSNELLFALGLLLTLLWLSTGEKRAVTPRRTEYQRLTCTKVEDGVIACRPEGEFDI